MLNSLEYVDLLWVKTDHMEAIYDTGLRSGRPPPLQGCKAARPQLVVEKRAGLKPQAFWVPPAFDADLAL